MSDLRPQAKEGYVEAAGKKICKGHRVQSHTANPTHTEASRSLHFFEHSDFGTCSLLLRWTSFGYTTPLDFPGSITN